MEAFVKKVWKCPLSCEPNGASRRLAMIRLWQSVRFPPEFLRQTDPSRLHRNSPVTGKTVSEYFPYRLSAEDFSSEFGWYRGLLFAPE